MVPGGISGIGTVACGACCWGGGAGGVSRVVWRRGADFAGAGAADPAGVAFAAGWLFSPGGSAGSAFMMLMAGIEADDGKSYLPAGGAVPVVVTRGAAASAGAATGAAAGSPGAAGTAFHAAARTITLVSNVRSRRLATTALGSRNNF